MPIINVSGEMPDNVWSKKGYIYIYILYPTITLINLYIYIYIYQIHVWTCGYINIGVYYLFFKLSKN